MDTNVTPLSKPAPFMAAGNLSLNLSYSRAESLSMTARRQNADGQTVSVEQALSRSFEANLSVDVSFLSRIEGAAQKMANIDPQVMASWQKEAGDLFSLSEKEFNEFVDATNKMFDEVEKALGMGPNGLDAVAGFMTGQVQGFLADVQQNENYMDANPLGQGEDMGFGIPALMDQRMADLPDALAKYLDQMKAQMDEQMKAFGQEKNQPLLLQMRSMFQEMLDRLASHKADEQEKPADTRDKDDAAKKNDAEKKPDASSVAREFRLRMEQRSSVSALMSYAAQIPSGGEQAPDTPLDVAA